MPSRPSDAGAHIDAIESAANALVGFLVSWIATWAVLGYEPAEAIGVTLMFFGLSFTRAWVLRRVFRRLA